MKQYVITGWGDTPLNRSQLQLDNFCKIKKAGRTLIANLNIGESVAVEFKTLAGWITYTVTRQS